MPVRPVQVSVPPLPAVSAASLIQSVPSAEISSRYCFAYAASQLSSTRETDAPAPRSMLSHCGSDPSALAQRVVASPSTALPGASAEVSDDEAVAGLPREISVSAPEVSVGSGSGRGSVSIRKSSP